MKNLIYVAGAVALLTFTNCNKSTDGNTGIIPTDSAQTGTAQGSPAEYTDRYVAEDGSSALVTFKNTGSEKSISISRDKMTINAQQKGTEEGVYTDHDYEIVAKNDSVTITQGNNVIGLKKARTQ
ncbi:hypothetical protein [Kaistella palustris]|uniref:hypothetical protein n=1 Tax=Kaistella palustris TaxID=493376 RepID=UPI0003F62321|nr:hypothetical protein [Kaistella palustris]